MVQFMVTLYSYYRIDGRNFDWSERKQKREEESNGMENGKHVHCPHLLIIIVLLPINQQMFICLTPAPTWALSLSLSFSFFLSFFIQLIQPGYWSEHFSVCSSPLTSIIVMQIKSKMILINWFYSHWCVTISKLINLCSQQFRNQRIEKFIEIISHKGRRLFSVLVEPRLIHLRKKTQSEEKNTDESAKKAPIGCAYGLSTHMGRLFISEREGEREKSGVRAFDQRITLYSESFVQLLSGLLLFIHLQYSESLESFSLWTAFILSRFSIDSIRRMRELYSMAPSVALCWGSKLCLLISQLKVAVVSQVSSNKLYRTPKSSNSFSHLLFLFSLSLSHFLLSSSFNHQVIAFCLFYSTPIPFGFSYLWSS